MALKFKNIRSNEIRVAETEPMISALWASSDMSPNITQGQDFGWRLAPEVAVELKRIKRDPALLQQIANNMKKSVEELNEPDLLKYISDHTAVENAPVAMEGDYEDEYRAEIKRIEQEGSAVDTRLEDAKIAAMELGIDTTPYGDSARLINMAIGKFKKKNNL